MANRLAIPERKTVKAALIAAGLSTRQAQALLRGGWPALVGESEAEAAELRDTIEALTLKIATIDEHGKMKV